MKRILFGIAASLALALAIVTQVKAATCTPTGFFRDSINMTAALINPGALDAVEVDATGCNIGVYFSEDGSISGATIHGANYFGVVVNGDEGNVNVDIKDSTIYDIGKTPFNGTQHGVAIYYRALLTTGSASGNVEDNDLSAYQKGGIVVNGTNAMVNTLGNI